MHSCRTTESLLRLSQSLRHDLSTKAPKSEPWRTYTTDSGSEEDPSSASHRAEPSLSRKEVSPLVIGFSTETNQSLRLLHPVPSTSPKLHRQTPRPHRVNYAKMTALPQNRETLYCEPAGSLISQTPLSAKPPPLSPHPLLHPHPQFYPYTNHNTNLILMRSRILPGLPTCPLYPYPDTILRPQWNLSSIQSTGQRCSTITLRCHVSTPRNPCTGRSRLTI